MGEVSHMLMPWAIADDAVEDFLRKLDPLLNMFNRVILRSKQREPRGNLHGQVRSVEPAITRSVVGSLGSSFASDESYSDDVRHYSLLSVVFAVLRIVGYLAPPERALYLLRLRGEADLKPTLERLHSHLTLQRLFLHNQTNYRLLSLHRRDLTRPLGDPLFRRAADACFEAARIIFATFQELQRQECPIIRLSFA